MRSKLTLALFFVTSVLVAQLPHKTGSVLATGQWYRISVTREGIYRISYEDLVSMGFNPGQVSSGTIRVYGNGGGMLPEPNASPRYDDLREIPVCLADGDDGKMDPGDYLLFYGEPPDNWIMNQTSHVFYHYKNLYSDSTYYFITAGGGNGKKIQLMPSLDTIPNSFSRRSSEYAFHEVDSVSLIKSGRIWFGEVFDNTKTSYQFNFAMPDVDTVAGVRVTTYVAARAPEVSSFFVYAGNEKIDSIQVEKSDLGSVTLFGKFKVKVSYAFHPEENFSLGLTYAPPSSSSTGWLNYLELNYQRNLSFVAPQMAFRDANSIGGGKNTRFIMTKATPSVRIWDVTDPGNVLEVERDISHDTITFTLPTDSLRQFYAFDGSTYYPVHLSAPVPNQNLHSLNPANLVIVTNPLFHEQAERLAGFHRSHSNLSVLVVDLDQVFTEFGSGRHDISAIRDFMKMLYDKGTPGAEPKYLLLFGDGSYDPKNRIPGNNNMIPTFQSTESLNFTSSFVTDDYYGIMGENEGLESAGTIDIGIGRLPATTLEDAKTFVDKIIHYASVNDTVYSDWRNRITFIADDPNKNIHLQQAEELAGIVYSKYPVFNVNKIYNDAYKMINTPSGTRIPDANKAITDAVMKGTLLLNYTGHGGENGWSANKVLTIQDIESWTNYDKLPVFVTATCEFSRFDNPERFTAGEQILLKADGGAIALYSTTRLAFSSYNFKLDSSFFLNLIPEFGKPYPKLGDLIRLSKNFNNNNVYIRNFVLLGDPAQSLAFPKWNVTTTEIRSYTNGVTDTAMGLSRMHVKGSITDFQGNKISSFNGTVYPRIYDKPVTYRTLGNTSDSYPQNFSLQNVLLYSGQVTVTNGDFGFDFVVPRSISLYFGKGKISYYAVHDSVDAWGYDKSIVIGGEDPGALNDDHGPDISLFMDNEEFKPGGMTNSDPLLLAFLSDTSGINFLGLGFGHEITAVIDGKSANPIILNDYFRPQADRYTKGSLSYPLADLPNGQHILTLKAWDMADNPSQEDIPFFVYDQPELSVRNVFNFPNPFRDETRFVFTPVYDAGEMEARIQIFNWQGQLVKTLSTTFYKSSGTTQEIPWDGTGDNGNKLGSGLYVYRLLVKGDDGTFSQTTQKLVILK